MEKFIIIMELLEDREFAPFLDRCVSYAIECNVKKLRLDFGLDDDDDDDEVDRVRRYYNLHPIVFCAKSIEVLKFARCRVGLPICVIGVCLVQAAISMFQLNLQNLYHYFLHFSIHVREVLLNCVVGASPVLCNPSAVCQDLIVLA
ncbi:hypothetical protein Ddye_014368 [Dipteronia dyeriana]|uniref:Uncharacterized protein n=1 Tax=Dipteronia dyeriana TaxID=168575 RepID=A0AAD9X854_9ROSI|nr:hypothetical protein Ddye_014368 [Dipteronia dyeriana]